MSKREAAPGFGDRMRRVRLRLGITNLADFARRVGVNYATYRQWEVLDAAPASHTLKRAIRMLNVQGWEKLFSWVCDGDGEPPAWFTKEGPVPSADEPEPEDSATATSATRPRPMGPRPPISWRAVELLVAQARSAQERGDGKELASIELAIVDLLCPHCRGRPHSPAPTPNSAGKL